MSEKKIYLAIHGHFYQPPRENPWLEAIELQESASPFHDWNERIHHECYLPNAEARVLDEKGLILDIVNNFEDISFNFGPTLMSWLRSHHPETYRRILEVDRISQVEHAGHGNAMAQVYHHIIMPLASRRDQVTQVRWGIEDFRFHFRRDPESIWLPETACHQETLEVLMEAGIRFVILDAHQAEAVRVMGAEDWQDVSVGTLDPRFPYRAFSKNDPEKFIDIFFYDGPVARAVGFGDLAFDAKRFAERLQGSVRKDLNAPQLIHVATDGETYGHHKPFGDRVLAYLTRVEAPRRGFRLVNYGEFLDLSPPEFEVRLKPGEEGEGTSWSCAHGVRRWKDHCGCRGGGPAEWKQHWRGPLRDSLDWLRDQLATIFETVGSRYLRDVWEVRDHYIQVLLNPTEDALQLFFDREARHSLNREEKVVCLKLLEMQRHAMMMYTSCGWFFTEISGIETVQILQYAARALELAEELTESGGELEEEFLSYLSSAPSNVPEFRDGRGVYERFVRPTKASQAHLVSAYAIESLFEDYFGNRTQFDFYTSHLEVLDRRKESSGNSTLHFGRVKAASMKTLEERDFVFAVVQIGLYDFRCSLCPFAEIQEIEAVEKKLFHALHKLHLVDLLKQIDETFGEKYFTLKDLPMLERRKLIAYLTREVIEKIGSVYENLYDENKRMNEIYRSIQLPIPEQVRYAVEHTLRKRLKIAVEQLALAGFDPHKVTPLYRVLEAAHSFDAELKTKNEEIARLLSEELAARTKKLLGKLEPEVLAECLYIPRIARKIGVELDLRSAQNDLFFLARRWCEHPETLPEGIHSLADTLLQLMQELYLHSGEFQKLMHHPKPSALSL